MSACLFIVSIDFIENLSTSELKERIELWKQDIKNITPGNRFEGDRAGGALQNLINSEAELYCRESGCENSGSFLMREGLSRHPAVKKAYADYIKTGAGYIKFSNHPYNGTIQHITEEQLIKSLKTKEPLP